MKAFPSFATKRFATGPAASPTTVSDELLEKLSKLSTQVNQRDEQQAGLMRWQGLIDGLWVMGWPSSYIEGAR